MSTALPMRCALVIANPVAGRGRGGARARELESLLHAEGVEVRSFSTGRRGDARARAAALEHDVDLVVSIGGDGTLSEVLDGLPRRDVPIGVLPLGTANVLALDLQLPREPRALVAALRTGRTQTIDTARVDGRRLSFLCVGVGFDAEVVHALEARRKGAITKLDWVRAGIGCFARYEAPRLFVEADGDVIAGQHGMVLISNIVHYGGFAALARERELDDGWFELYTFPASSRTRLLRHALRALVARFPGGGVERRRVRSVRVTSDAPVPYQIDGDAGGTTPLAFEVGAERFRIVVP